MLYLKKKSHEPFTSTFLPLAHFSKSSIGLIFDFYSLPISHLSLQLGFRWIFFHDAVQEIFSQIPFYLHGYLTVPTCHFSGHLGNSSGASLYISIHPHWSSTGQLPQKYFYNIWHTSSHNTIFPQTF